MQRRRREVISAAGRARLRARRDRLSTAEDIARAGEGDLAALTIYDERRLSRVGRGSPDQRPSMGQDMAKGRRTEIEFLNGFVVREGEQAGIRARANERLVDIVKKG